MIVALLTRIGSQILSVVLLFSLVYNVNFKVFPPATMGRLAVLYLIWEQRHILKERIYFLAAKHPYVLLTLAALLIHAVVGYWFAGRVDSVQMSRQFHFIFYSIFASYLYALHLRGNLKMFLCNFAIVGAIQGGMIIYSLFSWEYREWLASVVVEGGNYELTLATRPPGFSNSTGANLSVIQALGVFSCLWIAFEDNPWWAKVLSIIGAIVAITSTMLAGRTGLMLSGLFVATFCIRDLGRLRFKSTLVAAAFVALTVFQGPLLIDYLNENRGDYLPDFEKISNWAFEFFLSDGNVYSVYDLSTMPVPKLTFNTLIGTGMADKTGNDSGYIQSYYALGLLMAGVFYSVAAYLCVIMWRKSRERFLYLSLIGGIFLVELKEPFMLKYIYFFFIVSHYYLLAGFADAAKVEKHDQLSTQQMAPS